jgi:4'-phosphopantetheinyl transferase
VWALDLDVAPAGTREDLAALLSFDELQRAARYAFEHDRRRFMTCRGVLRLALAQYLNCGARELRFEHNSWNKPMLAGGSALRFNISHSQGLALLAFTQARDIGVDVEHLQDRIAVMDLAGDCFSVAERRALDALPPERRVTAFFACWTRKEAYIKARGQGLSLDLRSFDVSIDPSRSSWTLRDRGTEISAGWSLFSFSPAPQSMGALAVCAPQSRMSAYRWCWSALQPQETELPPVPEGVPTIA